MDIEEAIKILDKFVTEHKLFNIKHSNGLEQAIETLLTAYEKEKEKNKEKDKFEKILADNLKIHIASITIGKSITFPCGWVYKQDLLNLIDDIEWK